MNTSIDVSITLSLYLLLIIAMIILDSGGIVLRFDQGADLRVVSPRLLRLLFYKYTFYLAAFGP